MRRHDQRARIRNSNHELRVCGAVSVVTSLLLVLAAALAGCAVGPDYKRPVLNEPAAFRTASDATNAASDAASLGDITWSKAFSSDPRLVALINEALVNNWDVKIAAARVLQAEAAAGITRSQFFPTVSAGADYVTARASEKGPSAVPGMKPEREYQDVYGSMASYEVDLWGRIRRANESARAQLLATTEAQHAVRQTLVAQVASTYLNLLELDLELEIARLSYANRTNSLALTESRENGGVASMQDVAQAKILVATADAAVTDSLRRIEQTENELCILLGRNPGRIERGLPLVKQPVRTDIPSGLPSALLERRPDVRAAEQQLVSANANIGEAKAAFYPAITLTGFYGVQSVALSDLFTGPAKTWQFGPTVTMPLFTGGRLRSNLKLSQARFQETLARYQQTVQEAFRQVSDSLIACQRTREYRAKVEERTQAHREATALANIRYEGGVTSYLEVLYNEQELFNSELTLAQARRNELQAVVQLYRALGGGWQLVDSERQTAKR